MDNNRFYFTAGEFAKLNKLNKRTLHYYDEIGLFSPKYKGENGYRYYTYLQSMELERILALRELGMSIDDIKNYIEKPNISDFKQLAKERIEDIDKTIKRLKMLKSVIKEKEEMLELSEKVSDGQVEIVELDEERLLLTEVKVDFEDDSDMIKNLNPIMEHFITASNFCNYKKSFGSFISVDKINSGNFDEYDGVFTVVNSKKSNLFVKPKGKYIRGFCVGNWDKVPNLYNKMISFAKENNLTLCGNAYEFGINEFAISNIEEYVTQIEIMCK